MSLAEARRKSIIDPNVMKIQGNPLSRKSSSTAALEFYNPEAGTPPKANRSIGEHVRKLSANLNKSISEKIAVRKPSVIDRTTIHAPSLTDDETDIVYEDHDESSATAKAHMSKRPWYIIRPTSKSKSAWDFLVHLILLYCVFTIPYRLSFILDSVYSTADIAIDLLFTVDIMLTFFTGYYHEGIFVFDIRKIALEYFKKWFLIDFVAAFPLHLLVPVDESSNANISNFNKASRLGRLPRLLLLLLLLLFSSNIFN